MVMMANDVGDKKKRRVSKKKKIAWRKHCSTKDVDNFLEEVRHEERVGLKFSEAKDDQLFFESSDPSAKQEDENEKQEEKPTTKKVQTLPRCFQILLPHTAVPDPITKRNRVRTPEERKHPAVKRKEAQRKAQGILKAKEKEALQNRIVHKARLENRPKRGEFKYDLWSEAEQEAKPLGDTEWLKPVTLQHTLKNTGKMKKLVPKTVRKKTSSLPAIEVPHPGLSYNPSYADHQTLLREVAGEEIDLEKKQKSLDKATTKMFSRVTREEHERSWFAEMSEGLPKVDERVEIKDEKVEDDNEYKAINPPVKNKKKTRQQRRRLKKVKEEAYQRKLARIEKKKISDIYRLRKIQTTLQESELKSLKRQAVQNRKKALMEFEAKRLSNVKFQPAEQDFNLPSELSGNLRNFKAEGNLFNDRFKSLQKRNILPATVKQQPPKKAKQKRFIKSSHKITEQEVKNKCNI